jgi:anti-sigma B factor antagonist
MRRQAGLWGKVVCTVEVCCEVEADGTWYVTVSGEIDMTTADEFQEGLLQAIDGATGGVVVVDMSGVRFGDSSCLNALVAAHEIAQRRGVAFRVGRYSPQFRPVLEITGLLEVLTGADNHDGGQPRSMPSA